ncbi:putative SMARCAL1-like protein [Aphelenchoides besseyi]|nr:putative SMARCAL1-like protein [Aphelenchoides besseyi]
MTTPGAELTPEQLARIEANRAAAIAKLMKSAQGREFMEMRRREREENGGPPPPKVQIVTVPLQNDNQSGNRSGPSSWPKSNVPHPSTSSFRSAQPANTVVANQPTTYNRNQSLVRPVVANTFQNQSSNIRFQNPNKSNVTSGNQFRQSAPNPLANHVSNITVTLSVYSENEIQLIAEPYNEELVEVLRTHGCTFHKPGPKDVCQKATWRYKFVDHQKLYKRLYGPFNRIKCIVKPLPPWVFRVFSDAFQGVKKTVTLPSFHNKVETSLLDKLFPYQLTGLRFGVEKEGRVLLADEMGLGKSLQAMAIARTYSDAWPLLIVCPSSVRYAWKLQFEKFLPNVDDVNVIENGKQTLPSGRTSNTVVIISYDMMSIRVDELYCRSFRVIIFDESHCLKNEKSKRSKAAKKLSERAERRILLSGTPALSRPAELYSQINIVNKNIFGNYIEYAKRYCEYKKNYMGFMDDKGAENLEELSAILKHTCLIRRLKNDVLEDLPEKRRQVLYLTGNIIAKRLKAVSEARKEHENMTKKGTNEDKQRTLMEYYLQTGIAKADAVADHIIDNYYHEEAEGCKLLLFAHHKEVLDILENRMKAKNIATIRIDGQTKGPDRALYCKQFQDDPKIKVAVLSITAASVGITLTAASKVIFAELYWTPAIMIQAEDRAHRIGQRDSVLVEYVLAKKTADDEIWPRVQSKLHVLAGVDLNNETFGDLDNTTREFDDRPKITDFFSILDKKEKENET